MYIWKKEFEVGDELIDTQHQALMEMTQEIMTVLKNGDELIDVDDKLESLFTYAKEHFDAEENLMDRYDYPDLELHKLQHNDFKIKLAQLSEDLNKDNSNEALLRIAQFTMKWVMNHIVKSDLLYKAYLKG